jgi:hypothetical protein
MHSAHLKIDVTARCNQLLHDGGLTFCCCTMERRISDLILQVDVAARCNKKLSDGDMPTGCCEAQRRGIVIAEKNTGNTFTL